MRVEHALLTGKPLCGLSIDLAKAFDSLPQQILLQLAEEVGMDRNVLRALRGMYGSLQRRFRVDGHIGQPFQSTNGIMQGCPISVLLMNLFTECWVRFVKGEIPNADPQGYADDVGLTSEHPTTVLQACALTEEFANLTGTQVNSAKSHVWATTSERRDIIANQATIGQEALTLVTSDRRLGAHLAYTGRRARTTLSHKLQECVRMCERVQHLPISLPRRAHLVASGIMPKALYGCAATPPAKRDVRRLRAAAARAIWGQGNRWRSVEILFAQFCPGHRADPLQGVPRRSLNGFAP